MEEIEGKLKKIERIEGYELPEYFKQFYKEHNGGMVGNIEFLMLDEIINEINIISEEENIINENLEVEPKGSIKKVEYGEKRVPFITDYSGNFVGIDFDPGVNGVIGQVINYGGDEEKMYVFANTFKDFIEGIESLKIENDIYIVDYLIDNKINFIKPINENEIPKKIKLPRRKKIEIKTEKVNVYEKEIEFNEEKLNDIINICKEITSAVRNDNNVFKSNIIFQDYRIKNYKDYLSRTMGDTINFWNKLQDYPKEEIKGYSINVSMNLQQIIDENKIATGDEVIFVDIDKDKVLIRYRATVENEQFENAYNKLCTIFNKMQK